MYDHNFRVGDRVVAVEAVDGKHELIGKSGTVIFLSGSDIVSVEFDEPFRGATANTGAAKMGIVATIAIRLLILSPLTCLKLT